MGRKLNHAKICAMLAARNLYARGAAISEIARQAKKHPATIRRWLAAFSDRSLRRTKDET